MLAKTPAPQRMFVSLAKAFKIEKRAKITILVNFETEQEPEATEAFIQHCLNEGDFDVLHGLDPTNTFLMLVKE